MSEQTANLCTTDAAESLRAVVAERDREIERLNSDYNEACEDAMCVARELERQKMNCLNLLQQLEDLKAQPSGVVLPEPEIASEINRLIGLWDAKVAWSGQCMEELLDHAARAATLIARLNSSPVSAGDVLTSSECACGDQYPANSYGAGFMAANNGVCENCDAANSCGLGVADERSAFEAWHNQAYGPQDKYNPIRSLAYDSAGVGLGYDDTTVMAQFHAFKGALALSAPSHGEQVRHMVPSWMASARAFVDRLHLAGWRDHADAQHAGVAGMYDELLAAPSAGSQKEQGK